jgi:hypothetical protein
MLLPHTHVQGRVLQFVCLSKHDTRMVAGKIVRAEARQWTLDVGCLIVSTVDRALLRLLMVHKMLTDRVRSSELALHFLQAPFAMRCTNIIISDMIIAFVRTNECTKRRLCTVPLLCSSCIFRRLTTISNERSKEVRSQNFGSEILVFCH